MAKKRATSGDRSKDRHKPRKMIPVPPNLHEALERLAVKNSRPLSWQVRLIIEEALRKAGLLPSPSDD